MVILNLLQHVSAQSITSTSFNFYGDQIELPYSPSSFVDFSGDHSEESIRFFYEKINAVNYEPVVNVLLQYKEQNNPDDWMYYQLIRRTAQAISPKAENYHRYTLYKWFLLSKSGYEAMLCIAGNQILFYVQCDENIYNIPYRIKNGKQYVCLNYHDYGNNIDFEKTKFSEVVLQVAEAKNSFSYKLTRLPDFTEQDYLDKNLQFTYNENQYHFKVKLNAQVKNIFANYPSVDYASYFGVPLSKETYSSLIPALQKNLRGMSTKTGVDYLMRFTRYAFAFESDTEIFGQEKRLTPEQTLLYDNSDCEDRVALFFYLVKEIYDLPMIVLAYPKHVTIAVKFDKPVGRAIVYNGSKYSVCEPTPQKKDLPVGKLLPELRNTSYEIAFVYDPKK